MPDRDYPISETILIKQLKNSMDLYIEGGKLNHCVSSYSSNCRSGYCEIFSLRKIDFKNKETPLVTIEVRERKIFQVKADVS